MDIVYIADLTVRSRIGVFDWEKQIRQNLVFNLELATDVARAAQRDDLADAVNYKAVADAVVALMDAESFQLIETVAERVAALILSQFSVAWVKVKVAKPRILPNAREVGIQIERRAS